MFETDKPDGAAGSEAMRLGFVFKLPFLCGISGCFFSAIMSVIKSGVKRISLKRQKKKETKPFQI